ncbi:MAG: magnesium transporter [Rhodobacteraceae bacterium]|nr:magnesium transporter [Paracoccaceae bacterium]
MAIQTTGLTNHDQSCHLRPQLIESIIVAVAEGNKSEFMRLIDPLHEADIADLLEQINPEQRNRLIELWGGDFGIDVLSELEESLRKEVIDRITPEQFADTVSDLEADDIVDIVEDLDREQQSIILSGLERSDRAVIRMSLSLPENSAGRLMQRRFVSVPEYWNVGQTIDALRSRDDLPDDFHHVILVTPRMSPTGQVALGRIMASARDRRLNDLLERDFRVIPITQDQKDVAYIFNQYHMISAPVVDETNRLVGVITIDDAMSMLEEEAHEDILRLAGVGDESLTHRVFTITRQRLPWLLINLGTAILASLVIAQFADTIEALVALAVLMPIVASMGGNAGTQSLTVAVRSLATRDLTSANLWRIIRREGLVGLLNGVIFALIIGGIGILWFGDLALGIILASAMIITMIAAGLSGIAIPIGLERVRIDPAIASSVFVTTVTDVVGFFAFLGIATVFLL